MTSKQIRKTFLDFFEKKNHQIVSSAPMVVKGDPTLMFINSGMAPFKNWFLGNEPIQYPRVADTQKCLRVSGKHNDLEEVGVDTYHHTMFEMLGNWSFGDYFKEEAISWAWELLTEVYKIPQDRLYVTVFEGDKSENLAFDQEAYDIWKRFIQEDRILMGNKKDNFWEMGDSGPCGPCSEIHVDVRDDSDRSQLDGKSLVNAGHPQVIEIWNNVFMQYNRKADGSLEPLPNRHVDTGMGFERLCMVLQGKKSNYDTDVFTPLIQAISKRCGLPYEGSQHKRDIAMRVIADHLRAVSFAIADGQLPASSGAGYVIRRILRRAIRYAYSFLNQKEAFIHLLVNDLVNQMGDYFHELSSSQHLITRVIHEEEVSFLRTLEKGIGLLQDIIAKSKEDVLDGKIVFELYDTFGFPEDLTALIAAEYNKKIDHLSFAEELNKQKERSRVATKVETDDWIVLHAGDTSFIGYDHLECDCKILRYRRVTAKGKSSYQFVLDQTPFYAESGGQVGDNGVIESANERIQITDCKKENNLIVHFAEELPEKLSGTFRARVDASKRRETANNHSATHLLHEALREVLGTHVEQKGSLVHPDYLRFDFSHFAKIADDDLHRIEERVNHKIREAISLHETRNMPIEEARKTGAMMLFGEKYGEHVRVIQFGSSIELCGGTHVQNTASIGVFRILSEAGIAAGIRRIEAISGKAADDYHRAERSTLESVRHYLKAKDIIKSVQDLQSKNAELQKQVDQFLHEKAMNFKHHALEMLEPVNGIQFLSTMTDLEPAQIKDVAFQIKSEVPHVFAVFGSRAGGKPTLTCIIGEDVVKERNLNASQIIRELAKHIEGGGGGQAFFATAGGTQSEGLKAALDHAKSYIV